MAEYMQHFCETVDRWFLHNTWIAILTSAIVLSAYLINHSIVNSEENFYHTVGQSTSFLNFRVELSWKIWNQYSKAESVPRAKRWISRNNSERSRTYWSAYSLSVPVKMPFVFDFTFNLRERPTHLSTGRRLTVCCCWLFPWGLFTL